jgi:hypothetical protein
MVQAFGTQRSGGTMTCAERQAKKVASAARHLALAVSFSWTLCACSVRPENVASSAASATCPSPLLDGVTVHAYAREIAVPDDVTVPSGAVKLHAEAGRRVTIALETSPDLPDVRLLWNAITLTTYGGTLGGWAQRVEPPDAARDVSLALTTGTLRLAPFIQSKVLRPHTESIDVLVVPGGAPGGDLAVRPGELWDAMGVPVPPRALGITFTSIRHMRVLEHVDASVEFEFVARRRFGPHKRWECAVEKKFQLVDHNSVLPDLWTLRYLQRDGSRRETLALYAPSVGSFRVIFLDPATAAGFGRWLGETRAHEVGSYAVGFLAPDSPTGLAPATDEELQELAVSQFGEQ